MALFLPDGCNVNFIVYNEPSLRYMRGDWFFLTRSGAPAICQRNPVFTPGQNITIAAILQDRMS
ncbi:hypothetical protein TMES_00740 [Thalassospira mesophila]|uniref:Uncharacterized protein n=1 Tax=Thalassospira mesophila TaxID=1293891 RepID=A0A1Y2L4B9_9PROT|nr:hypothetical protein TMES_00740 [Thalassospira mesophila]